MWYSAARIAKPPEGLRCILPVVRPLATCRALSAAEAAAASCLALRRQPSTREQILGVGTISRIRTPNPNYPNLIPNYPNPNYPITISSRKLRNPNLIRVIWVLTPGTRITWTPLKPNRLWSNPLTWPQQPNKKFDCCIYWLLVCLIYAIIAISWSYFCISSPFLPVA